MMPGPPSYGKYNIISMSTNATVITVISVFSAIVLCTSISLDKMMSLNVTLFLQKEYVYVTKYTLQMLYQNASQN